MLYLMVLLLIIIGVPIIVLSDTQPSSKQLYVVPFPSLLDNESDGSFTHPYSSLQQALDHIERDYYQGITTVNGTTINLYPTHHFVGTIHFGQAHSHTRLTTMNIPDTVAYEELAAREHTHRQLSTAVISGGVPITGWSQVSGDTYSAVVPSLSFVNQLFVDNQRIFRTRVPMNHSDYLQYAEQLNDSSQARYGFQYVSGQFDFKSLIDAMVIVYHSWTESHHYIDKLITTNNTVLFSNPFLHLLNQSVTQGNRRFHIENLCEALAPNSFCFVNQTKTIYLMTNGSYDPTKSLIITSVNETVVSIGSDDVNNPVKDIIIDNLAIQHGAWNIDRTEVAEAASAAFLTTAALVITNATSILVSNIEISHTGSYGLRIMDGTSYITVINSLITDTGAGGVRIGELSTGLSTAPNTIKFISNEISYGGNVFPSGVGLIIHSGIEVVIADNTIHHLRYTGLSVGQGTGYGQAATKNILVHGNYIYTIGQHILCDQGGIYTLGVQPGTIINGNVIKNVFSYIVYMWGIYLDNASSDIIVSNNIVYNTGWSSIFHHYGANNTIINNVFARASLFPPPYPDYGAPDGDVSISDPENHLSWTYTRNIVYDIHQGTNHSAIKLKANVTALFNNNLYFNSYGTPLLFGPNRTSFSEWQKTGQDRDSIIADPLFAGDVNQCDFFTVQCNSPAAKLGFVNLTKLSQWTPGCSTDDEINNNQFYHW